MKKILILLLAIFISSSSIWSQNDIYFGIKSGLNLSTQDVNNSLTSYSKRPGFTGGAFFLFDFSDFSIQSEFTFSQQGADITFDNEDLYGKFSYLNVPILFKYSLNSGINFQAGPQIGFLLCAKSNYHPILKQKYKEQSYTKAYKSVDFSASFGVGWESKKNILIDARYNLGLSSINDNEGVPDTKNNVISITIGYKLMNLINKIPK
ncbi:porin family protein [Psychroserpens jangbogonensis]|uniref:porin family protein n=1 Tax=Psychroserpens jangbogonensis TaxID=1484460 RepID=UPI00053E5D55|nr:porin family protein [Psychroserpens jangbogonensis]